MIERIHIENFLGFQSLEYKDVSAVTVIIGKNDSGKTGLLKLLYAISKSLVEIERSDKTPNLKTKIGDKLVTTFFPRKGGIGSLVTKGSENPLNVNITFKGDETLDINFSFTKDAIKEPGTCSTTIRKFTNNFKAIFIPAKEVLTAFRAIPLSRENYDYEEFDDTYFDLIKSLRIPTSKGKITAVFSKVSNDLEDMFEGEIVQTPTDQTNPFMFKKDKFQFTMSLTAEGIKKIGILTTLIRNRELGANTIIFLDEPETALHPEAQRKFAEMLFELTKINGVKVILATHSYFIINQFSMIARREKASINCISIEKEREKTIVQTKIHDLKEGLPENSIISEVQEMFRDDMKIELGL